MKKKILIAIPCILIIIILVILVVKKINFNKNSKDDNSKTNNGNLEEEKVYDGYVNYEYLENAEIKDGVKYNTSKKIKEDHIAGNYKFSDMKIYSNDCCSVLEFNVSNNVDKNINQHVNIEFYNNKKETIYVLELRIKQENIKTGVIKTEIPDDIINAYDYKLFGLD